MPKRTDISSILIMGAAAFAPANAAKLAKVRPPQYQVAGWSTACWPGDDGFAASCEARKKDGPYVLKLVTGDSQFFQLIEHPKCNVDYINVFRDDLPAGKAERDRHVLDAFRRLAREVRKACPKLPPLRLKAGPLPDIANAGEEIFR